MFTPAHTTYFEELSRNASRVVAITRRAAEFGAEDAAAYWEALFADGLLPPEYLPNARRVFPGYTPHGASNFEVFLNVCAKDEAARGLCPQVPRTVARRGLREPRPCARAPGRATGARCVGSRHRTLARERGRGGPRKRPGDAGGSRDRSRGFRVRRSGGRGCSTGVLLEPLLRSLHARRIPRPPEDRPRP